MIKVAYFSKMFQAVPALAQISSCLPGVFVSNRSGTLAAAKRNYPLLQQARYSRWFGPLAAGNRTLSDADVIVTGSPNKKILSKFNAKSCMVFHGTYMHLDKKILIENTHFDLICAIGPRMLDTITRHAENILPKSVTTGYLPFCEFPEKTPNLRRDIITTLGLDHKNKTIVYMPSGRGVGSWELLAENLIKNTPNDFNLIIRPHPSHALTSKDSEKKFISHITALTMQRKNTILDLTELPLSNLFIAADLLVSDGTSPAEESLFYNIPQLFIETRNYGKDFVTQRARMGGMHEDEIEKLLTLYDCGYSRFVPDSSYNATKDIEDSLSFSDDYSPKRRAYFSWVFGTHDRRSNQRVANAINTMACSNNL